MRRAAIGIFSAMVSLACAAQGLDGQSPELTLAKVERAYKRVADNVFLQRALNDLGNADEEVWVEVRFRNDANSEGRHIMMVLPGHSTIETGDLVEVRLAQSRKSPRVAPLPDVSRILRLAAKGFSAQARAFDGVAGSEREREKDLARFEFPPGRLMSGRREF